METAQRVKCFFLIEESFIGNGEDKSSFFLKKFEFGGVGVGFRADGAMLVPVLVGNSDSESFRQTRSITKSLEHAPGFRFGCPRLARQGRNS